MWIRCKLFCSSNLFFMRKDHFNQNLLLWDQLSFKETTSLKSYMFPRMSYLNLLGVSYAFTVYWTSKDPFWIYLMLILSESLQDNIWQETDVFGTSSKYLPLIRIPSTQLSSGCQKLNLYFLLYKNQVF